MLKTQDIPIVDKKALNIIGFQVNAAICNHWFFEAERDDLEQNLALVVLRRSAQFDPSVGSWPTFVKSVSRRALISLAYRARKHKLHHPQCGSLNQPRHDADGNKTELGDQLDQEVANNRKGTKTRSEYSHFELQHDISVVITKLPEDQKEFCAVFLRTESITESAIECSVAPSTLYRRIHKVRDTFKEHEIHRHRQ